MQFPPPRPPRVDELLPRGAPFRDVERDIFRYLGGLAAVGGFAAALFFFLSLGALPVILLSVGGVGAILYAGSAGEGAFFASNVGNAALVTIARQQRRGSGDVWEPSPLAQRRKSQVPGSWGRYLLPLPAQPTPSWHP